MEFHFIGRPDCAPKRGRQRHLIAAPQFIDVWAVIGELSLSARVTLEFGPTAAGVGDDSHAMAAVSVNAPSVDGLTGDALYWEHGAGDLRELAMGDEPVPMRLMHAPRGLWKGWAASSFEGGCDNARQLPPCFTRRPTLADRAGAAIHGAAVDGGA